MLKNNQIAQWVFDRIVDKDEGNMAVITKNGWKILRWSTEPIGCDPSMKEDRGQ